MARCQCGAEVISDCQCSVRSTNCVEVTGSGNGANPFVFDPILSDDALNIIRCGPSGLLAVLPSVLTDPPTAAIWGDTNQSIGEGSSVGPVEIQFTDLLWDSTGAMWSASEPNVLTIVTDGVYEGLAAIRYATEAAGGRSLRVELNGGQVELAATTVSANKTATETTRIQALIDPYPFKAGDKIRCMAYQSSGSALNSLTVANQVPILALVYCGPYPPTS